MAKFDIPKFKWLFQDSDGDVWVSTSNPNTGIYYWVNGGTYYFIDGGQDNQNWRDTLIDLDKDDYELEDGILRRIDK